MQVAQTLSCEETRRGKKRQEETRRDKLHIQRLGFKILTVHPVNHLTHLGAKRELRLASLVVRCSWRKSRRHQSGSRCAATPRGQIQHATCLRATRPRLVRARPGKVRTQRNSQFFKKHKRKHKYVTYIRLILTYLEISLISCSSLLIPFCWLQLHAYSGTICCGNKHICKHDCTNKQKQTKNTSITIDHQMFLASAITHQHWNPKENYQALCPHMFTRVHIHLLYPAVPVPKC